MPSIRVVIRYRPINGREKRLNKDLEFPMSMEEMCPYVISDDLYNLDLWTAWPRDKKHKYEFTFDKVLWTCSQDEAFEGIGLPIVKDFVTGINGTIFAYGQSGSGKSFTMFGQEPDLFEESATGKRRALPIERIKMPPPEMQGLIPRCTSYMFKWLNELGNKKKSSEVHISFYEIYIQGMVRDLLDEGNLLDIREFTSGVTLMKKGASIAQLKDKKTRASALITKKAITDLRGMLQYFVTAQKYRTVKATKLNPCSSRGHCIMRLYLDLEKKDGEKYSSMFNFADLAGSEKTSKSEATGDLLVEAKYINQSLTTLGQVISALAKVGKKGPRPPFRDSALSHCLKDSLMGNTRTSVVIAASPHVNNVFETLSSLMFGKRCKSIKTKVKRNVNLSPAQMKKLIEKQKAEIARLKKLVGKGVGPVKPYGPAILFTQGVDFSATDADKKILEKKANEFFTEFGKEAQIDLSLYNVQTHYDGPDGSTQLGLYFVKEEDQDMMELLDFRDQMMQYTQRLAEKPDSMFLGEISKEDPLDPGLMARWRSENMEMREEVTGLTDRLGETQQDLHRAEERVKDLNSTIEKQRDQEELLNSTRRKSALLLTESAQKKLDENDVDMSDNIEVVTASVEAFMEEIKGTIPPKAHDSASIVVGKCLNMLGSLLTKTNEIAKDKSMIEQDLRLTKENYKTLGAQKEFFQMKLADNAMEKVISHSQLTLPTGEETSQTSTSVIRKVTNTAQFWKKLSKKGDESFRELVFDTAAQYEYLDQATQKYFQSKKDGENQMDLDMIDEDPFAFDDDDDDYDGEHEGLLGMTDKDVENWIVTVGGSAFQDFGPHFDGYTGVDLAKLTQKNLKGMGMDNQESLQLLQLIQGMMETVKEDIFEEDNEAGEEFELDTNKFAKYLTEFRPPELCLLQQLQNLDPNDVFDENDYVGFKSVYRSLNYHLNDKMLICKIFSLLDERQSGLVSTTLLIDFIQAVKEFKMSDRIMTDVSPYSNYQTIVRADATHGRLNLRGAKQLISEFRGCAIGDIRDNDLGVTYLIDLDEDQLQQLLENCPEAAWKTIKTFHPFEKLIRHIEADMTPEQKMKGVCDLETLTDAFAKAGIEEITSGDLQVALQTVGTDYSAPFKYMLLFGMLSDPLSDVEAIRAVMDRTTKKSKNLDRIVPPKLWLMIHNQRKQALSLDRKKQNIQKGVKQLVRDKSKARMKESHTDDLARIKQAFEKQLEKATVNNDEKTQEFFDEQSLVQQEMASLLKEKAEMARRLEEEISMLKESHKKHKTKLKDLANKAHEKSMMFHEAEEKLGNQAHEYEQLKSMYEEHVGVTADERKQRQKELGDAEVELLRLKTEKLQLTNESEEEKQKRLKQLKEKEEELETVRKEKRDLDKHKREIMDEYQSDLEKKRREMEERERLRNTLLAQADFELAKRMQEEYDEEIRASQRRRRERETQDAELVKRMTSTRSRERHMNKPQGMQQSSSIQRGGTVRKKMAYELHPDENVKIRDGGKGSVRFQGYVEGLGHAVGVELFMGVGNSDGSHDGQRYFRTKPNMAIFVGLDLISHVYRVNSHGKKEKIRFQPRDRAHNVSMSNAPMPMMYSQPQQHHPMQYSQPQMQMFPPDPYSGGYPQQSYSQIAPQQFGGQFHDPYAQQQQYGYGRPPQGEASGNTGEDMRLMQNSMAGLSSVHVPMPANDAAYE